LFALAGLIPTELGKLANMKGLDLRSNNLNGKTLFAHETWLAWLVATLDRFVSAKTT
jgi:hypothetical protein